MTIITRIPVQTSARAATVALLQAFKDDTGIPLQIHKTRPRKIAPPTAFVESISEDVTYYFGSHHDRRPVVTAMVLHGLLLQSAGADAADQRDAFVDAFFDWVLEHRGALDPKADFRIRDIEDEGVFIPDWLPPNEQSPYYGTRISLEGFTTQG